MYSPQGIVSLHPLTAIHIGIAVSLDVLLLLQPTFTPSRERESESEATTTNTAGVLKKKLSFDGRLHAFID